MANDILKPVELTDEPAFVRKVINRAIDFFEGDEKTANRWLNRVNRVFHGKTPLDVASQSDEGAESVLLLLDRLERGIFD